jgi:hypothetical protein
MGITMAGMVALSEFVEGVAVAIEIAGAVATVASISDATLGTNIITPSQPEGGVQPYNEYAMGGPSFKDPTPAHNLAEGLNNYLQTLIDVAPSYVQRYRPTLRDSYEETIERRRQVRLKDEKHFEETF